jgi:hypothetical protein
MQSAGERHRLLRELNAIEEKRVIFVLLRVSAFKIFLFSSFLVLF